MKNNAVSILGLPIQGQTLSEAAKSCQGLPNGYVCFVNAHTSSEAVKNSALLGAFKEATFLFPDGMPLVWLSRLLGTPVPERVCGPDFMAAFLEENSLESHAFIGGTEHTLEFLRVKVKAGTFLSTPMRDYSVEHALEDWAELCKLAGRHPRFVWVGLGAPKQELWMRTVSSRAPNTVFFGVGAAFDFLAGTKTRAPSWMRKSGLEWFYRLAQEPSRLAYRYGVSNFLFIVYALKDALSSANAKKKGPDL